jgi:hypothetical protein
MSEAPDEPTELSALEPEAAPRRRRRWALWGALAVVALGAGAVAVIGPDDGDPPKLPLALGAAPAEGRSTTSPMAAVDSMLAFVHYVAGDDLPALGGSGPAYRLRDPDAPAIRHLADALGLDGGRLTHQDTLWEVRDDRGDAFQMMGRYGGWSYSRSFDASGGSSGSSGSATEPMCPPDDAACAGGVMTTEVAVPTTVAPVDLPSEAEARSIALRVFDAAGGDRSHAEVTVDRPLDSWVVTIVPSIGGLPAVDMATSVAVGSKGAIQYASGNLASSEHLGDYGTIDTGAAIERLNAGTGFGNGPAEAARADVGLAGDAATTAVAPADPNLPVESPAIGYGCAADAPLTTETTIPADDAVAPPPEDCPPPTPTEVVLHHAERILVQLPASDGSSDWYLVPGYRMTGDDGATVQVPAVDDDSLLPTTTIDPADGSGGSTVTTTPCELLPPDVPEHCSPPTTPIPPVGAG